MLHTTLSQIDASVAPDYLLVCRADAPALTHGTWYFALESADGAPVFEAGDEELGDLNRLTLLAAVRGLESIDGPAAVTLLSSNRYLIRSLADSLPRWRENDFVWEHFGRRIDVQHADLWRRIDRALSIHRVEACLISSRLVSAGQTRAATAAPEKSTDRPLTRIDGAHPAPSTGPAGRRRGSRPTAASDAHADASDVASQDCPIPQNRPMPRDYASSRSSAAVPAHATPSGSLAAPPLPSRQPAAKDWQGPWSGDEALETATGQETHTPRVDPLRRWLLKGDRPEPAMAPRRRFTASDLLATT